MGLASTFFTVLWVVITSAAPSLIEELEAAVMVPPSFLKAGLRLGILSSLTLPGPSSALTRVSPPRPLSRTGEGEGVKQW